MGQHVRQQRDRQFEFRHVERLLRRAAGAQRQQLFLAVGRYSNRRRQWPHHHIQRIAFRQRLADDGWHRRTDSCGDNSGYGGNTAIVAGILEAASPAALPSGIGYRSVQNGGTLAVNVDVNTPAYWAASDIGNLLGSGRFGPGAFLGIDTGTGTFSYGNGISDTTSGCPLGLAVLGSGTLVLPVASTYSGGTRILGPLDVDSPTELGNSAETITLDGGMLQATANLNLSAPMMLARAAARSTSTRHTVTLASDVGGSGGLMAIDSSGGGLLTLTNTYNWYSGGTTIVGAAVSVASSSCLGNYSSPITFDGGTLLATGGLSLYAPIVLNPGGGTIDVNGFNSAL